jgi:hypothetical protein
MSGLRWETDGTGDTLWLDGKFLGCIYDQDRHGLAGASRPHGWRALEGEELILVGNVVPSLDQPDARMGARALLEAHVGGAVPLPTALELLALTEN